MNLPARNTYAATTFSPYTDSECLNALRHRQTDGWSWTNDMKMTIAYVVVRSAKTHAFTGLRQELKYSRSHVSGS